MAGQLYQVVAPLVVIRKDGHERYVDKGGLFSSDSLDEANAEHLLGLGLIEAVELAEVVVTDPNGAPVIVVGSAVAPVAPEGASAAITPVGTEGVEIPEGAPVKAWTHAQIDAWAASQNPPIALEGDASKDVKLEAIAGLNQS